LGPLARTELGVRVAFRVVPGDPFRALGDNVAITPVKARACAAAQP
jgi:hypothetical protein